VKALDDTDGRSFIVKMSLEDGGLIMAALKDSIVQMREKFPDAWSIPAMEQLRQELHEITGVVL